jgi:hypothetical protein
MSLEMTFRQKLIRVACSSAVCGLSFSFLFGEAVDQKATLLRTWTPDTTILPLEYLPVQPISRVIEAFHPDTLQQNLLATNSVDPIPARLANIVALPKGLPPLPALAPKDELKFLAAAPTQVDEPKKLEAPASVVPVVVAVRGGAPVVSSAVSAKKSEPAPELKPGDQVIESGVEPKKEQKIVAAAPPSSSKAFVVTDASPLPTEPVHRKPAAMLVSDSGWSIEGQILGNTAQNSEPGHFEVALYAKRDADGSPVGFPLVQQILPAGKTAFKLSVPAKIEHGFLFGEFVSAHGGKRTLVAPASNPWKRGVKQVAELFLRPDDNVISTAAASMHEAPRDLFRVQGTVNTLFAPAGAPIPQEDVLIKVRGRKEATRSDSKGAFTLDLPKVRGTVFLEFLKAGYHPVILAVNAEDPKPLAVALASRHAVDQIAQRMGISQGSSRGIFIGRAVGADGAALHGLTAQLSVKADGPFYFDDDGQPNRDARGTGADGRFLFLNVESGVVYVDAAVNGEPVAPFALSTVEGGELVQKTLQPVSGAIRGRLFNPVSSAPKLSPLAGARVRVEGSTDYVTTDSFGAFTIGPIRWMKGERIALEFSAERFNNHRYLINADNSGPLNLFAFPAAYISHLAQSMDVDLDPYAGIVMGKITGASVRVDAMADHSLTNNAKDFYFDSHGRLKGSHEMTDSRFGTYMILNVPKGRAILEGSDANGMLRFSESIQSSPSSVSVVMD